MKNIITKWDGISPPKGNTYTLPGVGLVDDYVNEDDALIDPQAVYSACWDGVSDKLSSVVGSCAGRVSVWAGWPT